MSAARIALTVVAAFIPGVVAPAVARAAEYTFANVVDSRGEFGSFGLPAAMNNAGTVALVGVNDSYGRGVFAGEGGGALRTLVPFNTVADDDNFPGPAINDAGTVVFARWDNRNVNGALLADPASGGPLRTITDTTTGPFYFLSRPALNDAGTIALVAGHRDQGMGVYTVRNDGTVQTVVTFAAAGYSGVPGFVAMNNAGAVAFMAQSPAGQSIVVGTPGGELTTVDFADGTGPVTGFGQTFDVNDAGTVAYKGFQDPQVRAHGIYTSSGGPGGRTLVADTAGAYLFLEHPFINNAGTVVFEGITDGGADGVFTGPDPLSDKVVATGDPLFGSTVRAAAPAAFNDAGQVAVYYVLADGTTGIAVATPVPEPAAGAALAVAAAALLRRRRS